MTHDDRESFVQATRHWTEVTMHNSMHGFIGNAKRRGLSMSQIGALFFVQHQGSCGLSAIGENLGVSNAAASQMLDRLVHAGYAVRAEDAEDRRAVRIELTTEGRELVHETVEARQRWIEALADELSPEERLEAARVLENLARHTRQPHDHPHQPHAARKEGRT